MAIKGKPSEHAGIDSTQGAEERKELPVAEMLDKSFTEVDTAAIEA